MNRVKPWVDNPPHGDFDSSTLCSFSHCWFSMSRHICKVLCMSAWLSGIFSFLYCIRSTKVICILCLPREGCSNQHPIFHRPSPSNHNLPAWEAWEVAQFLDSSNAQPDMQFSSCVFVTSSRLVEKAAHDTLLGSVPIFTAKLKCCNHLRNPRIGKHGRNVISSGQVWEHLPEQRVATSTFRRYSRGLRLAIPQADAWPIPISLRC